MFNSSYNPVTRKRYPVVEGCLVIINDEIEL